MATGPCQLGDLVNWPPDGARLVARMRRLYPELPVLHLDDQSHPPVPEFPPEVPTLSKPFDHDVLLAKVEELLRR